MSDEHPKLFISYSWTSEEHEKWVIDLASQLRQDGVDVILDKWELREGHDAYAFMEKMVTDAKIRKVALICDRVYAEKADGRSGGVGTETQIITGEIYDKVDQDKFVAIVVERDDQGKLYLPAYYRSRVYIDMSDPDLYAKSYEQLLRWVYGKPFYTKPELGEKPAFLLDTSIISLGTTTAFRRALDAIKNNKDYWLGALSDYFDSFVQNLDNFRITEYEGEYDEKVIDNLEQFIPYRNEAITIFQALARYRQVPEAYKLIHRFFERLIPYMNRTDDMQKLKTWDFDNFRFIVHELFLYAIAVFLKDEWFKACAHLLSHQFYVDDKTGRKGQQPYSYLRQHMESLVYRNKRLANATSVRKWSLRADLLKERAKSSGVSFQYLMQADFVLYVRDAIDALRYDEWKSSYWPETLMYLTEPSDPIELFARAESLQYFNEMKIVLNVSSKKELEPFIQAFRDKIIQVLRWDWKTVNQIEIMGFEKLATKP